MTRNTIFGILAVLAIASFAIPGAAAMQCNDGKMAIMSPSDRIACVTEKTFEKLLERGWMEVSSVTSSDSLTISDNLLISNQNNAEVVTVTTNSPMGGHGYSSGYKSDSTFTFPETVNVGQEFVITYEVVPRGDNLTEEQIQLVKDYGMKITYPNELSMQNVEKHFIRADLYDKHGYYGSIIEFDTYSGTAFNGQITLALNNELYHDDDVISISAGVNDRLTLRIDKTESGITLTQSRYDPTDFSGNPLVGSGRNLGTIPDGVLSIVDYVPEIRPELPAVSGQAEIEQVEYLPRDSWEGFAEMLRYYEDEIGIKNFTEYIVNNMGLSEEFADEYIEAYPEFRTQSIPSGPSGQADAPPAIFVQGTFDAIQRDNSIQPVKLHKVCLFDRNLSTNTLELLYFDIAKRTPACTLTNNEGGYSAYAIADDPNDNTRPDINVGVFYENGGVKFTNNDGTVIKTNPMRTFNNHPTNGSGRF